MIRFIYLIQGKASEVNSLKEVFLGKKSLILTWDLEVENCIFFPKSTWSQGRRELLKRIDLDDYDYIVYCDGDISVARGSIDSFEKKIEQYLPAVAVPVVEKNTRKYKNYIKIKNKALIFSSDEQFQAIRKDVLISFFNKNPYVSQYDKYSWWYPCVIMQSTITRYLWRSSLVDLDFEIKNNEHGTYQNDFSPSFINDELKKFGISWYFPLDANNKNNLKSWYFKLGCKLIDRITLFASIFLFSLLYKNLNKNDLEKICKEKIRKIFN